MPIERGWIWIGYGGGGLHLFRVKRREGKTEQTLESYTKTLARWKASGLSPEDFIESLTCSQITRCKSLAELPAFTNWVADTQSLSECPFLGAPESFQSPWWPWCLFRDVPPLFPSSGPGADTRGSGPARELTQGRLHVHGNQRPRFQRSTRDRGCFDG
jgi:hypothetical protein